MKGLELIGGPLDGARAERNEHLKDGENVLIEDKDGGADAVYTVQRGALEYNAELTFSR